MPRSNIRLLSVGINLSLATLLTAVSVPTLAQGPTTDGAGANAAGPRANPPIVFAQTQSDLAVDPAARYGRLDNGMTYVIYKNKTPPGTASVWLRIGAGSVMEQENQRGLAHFIEHMAFNGSKNVPEGEMIKLLERDGLQFGADTNAETSNFQTVYKLNLPDANMRIIGDALFLMRETAGNISFKPDAIDRERGVVLGEERARASLDFQAYQAQLKLMFAGTKYPDRMPIGKVDVLKAAQRQDFLRFYADFYRPEYATVIVAGDVEPDRVEAEIRQRFSDWRPAPHSPAALTDFGTLAVRATPVASVFTADGLNASLSVSWVAPAQDVVETKAKDFADKVFAIASGILDERFARAANGPTSTFVGAGLQQEEIPHTARMISFNVLPKDGQDKAALEQATAMLRDYLANGPTQSELDRAVLRYERLYREGAAGARTVPTQAIAELIVLALATKGVIQSPTQAFAAFEASRRAFTLAAINAVLKQIKPDNATVLWRQGEPHVAFDEAALVATWRRAIGEPVKSYAAQGSVTWPYTKFGTPSAVVTREALPDVGATRVTFANGVVLTVKQTKFEDSAVHVSVQVGNGNFGIRPTEGATLFMAKQVGLVEGGLGKASVDDIRQALAGKIYGMGFTIGNNAAILSGNTTTADLAIQMQVLAAFLSDPGLRPDALDRVKNTLPAAFRDGITSPDGVYGLQASGNPYNNDPRFTTPSQSDALAVSNDQIAALIRNQLGHGPVDVTIVGDITQDEAIKQVGATLGALPPLPVAVPVEGAERLHFPTTDLHRIYTHSGRSDQNLSVIAWPTTDYYADPRRASVLELLAAVMTVRELDEVREKQGATYSASANSATSRYFPGFGFIISRASVRPEIDDTYYKTVSEISDDLKQHPVTTDELTRVRLPLIDRLHNDANSNGYWLARLSGTIRDPRQIATTALHERNLLSVTPDDIRKAAATYLDMTKALRIQIKPKQAAAH